MIRKGHAASLLAGWLLIAPGVLAQSSPGWLNWQPGKVLESSLLFHPTRASESWAPPPPQLAVQDIWLQSADGTQGQELAAAAREPKRFLPLPGSDHNDPLPPLFFTSLADFLRAGNWSPVLP